MTLTIVETTDINACLSLRRTVFIEEQNVPEAEEIDDLDGDAIHLLATVNGLPTGTARLLTKGETLKIGRVCVLQSQRGTGQGAALIRYALDLAKNMPGIRRSELGAQIHALPFYEKLGFTAYGLVYDDAGIPHRDMEFNL